MLMQSKASPGEVEHHHPENRKEVSSQSGKEALEVLPYRPVSRRNQPGPDNTQKGIKKQGFAERKAPPCPSFLLDTKTKKSKKGRTGLAISLCRGAALECGASICVHRAIWARRGESTQFSIVTRYGAQVLRVRNGPATRQLRASHWAQNATDSFTGRCQLPYLLVVMLSISLTEIHTTHACCLSS